MAGSPLKRERRKAFEAMTAAPDKLMAQIVEHVSGGHGLTSFAQGIGQPISSLHDWVRRDPERAEQYDAARRLGATALVEQSLRVLDECERNAAGELTGPGVALARTKSETLRWVAARIAPRDWGDSSPEGRPAVTINISSLIAERLEFARPSPAYAQRVEDEPEDALCLESNESGSNQAASPAALSSVESMQCQPSGNGGSSGRDCDGSGSGSDGVQPPQSGPKVRINARANEVSPNPEGVMP